MEFVVCSKVELAIVSLVAEVDRIIIACEAHRSVLAGETAWLISYDGHAFEHRVLDDFFCICPLDDVWLARFDCIGRLEVQVERAVLEARHMFITAILGVQLHERGIC